MSTQKHFIPNFEVRSVLLMAAFAMGSSVLQAQTASAAAPVTPSSLSAQAGPVAVADKRSNSQILDAAFSRADTNHDGRLTHEEAERFPAMAQQFEKIDSNQDNFISLDEFYIAAGS